MIRVRMAYAILLLALLVLSACAGSGPQAAQSSETPAGEVAVGENGLPALSAGALKSFTAEIEYKTESLTPAPQVETWADVEMRYQGEPAPGTYGLTVTDRTGNIPGGEMRMVVVGQDGYIYSAEQRKWLKVSMASNPDLAGLSGEALDPNKLAARMPAGVFVEANVVDRSERIERVETTHYRIDGALLEELLKAEHGADVSLVAGQADLWVANNGSYLKQYSLDATAQDAQGRQIRQTAEMHVTGENRPVNIAIPSVDQIIVIPLLQITPEGEDAAAIEELQTALDAMPPPPSGRIANPEDISPDMQSQLQTYAATGGVQQAYLSSASAEEIVTFYQEELPELGWAEVMSTASSGPGQPAVSLFAKGQVNLLLITIADPASAQNVVLIHIEE